jgi:hypothetical protein
MSQMSASGHSPNNYTAIGRSGRRLWFSGDNRRAGEVANGVGVQFLYADKAERQSLADFLHSIPETESLMFELHLRPLGCGFRRHCEPPPVRGFW